MGMLPITIRKRTIAKADLELIQAIVQKHWNNGRTQISEILCKKWPQARLRLGENWVHPVRKFDKTGTLQFVITRLPV